MMNDKVKEFCQMHMINIIDQNKRAHKMTKFNTKYFQFNDDYNKLLRDTVTLETEKLYTVEISESELEKIAEFESQVFNHMRAKGHYDLFNNLMQQKQREKTLRDNYPSVKKAYEHYSLMLKLAESGEI